MEVSRHIIWLFALGVQSLAGAAQAQDNDADALMALGDRDLVSTLTERYEAGLSLSETPAIVNSDDPRYTWALETKVQCAIALGFMRGTERDRTSIEKCSDAYSRMTYVAPPRPVVPPPVAQPPVRRNESCDDPVIGLAFFEFDSADLSTDARNALRAIVDNISACGWRRLTVVGHTDQAGTGGYNQALSEQRAANVTASLRSLGAMIPIDTRAEGETNPRVPLPDGTRSPQNRRVEISAD